MRGERVIIRTFGGNPLVRRIWDQNDVGFFITTDEQFELLSSGKSALEPIGIPKEDVFEYDPIMAEKMEGSKWDWKKLLPYKSK